VGLCGCLDTGFGLGVGLGLGGSLCLGLSLFGVVDEKISKKPSYSVV